MTARIRMALEETKRTDGTTERPRRPRWGVLGTVLGVLAIPAGLAWYAWRGMEGLGGFLLGCAFGLLVAFLGHLFMRRQVRGSSSGVVGEMFLGVFLSMGSFLVGMLMLSVVWRRGLVPASVTALVVYLVIRLFDIISVQLPPAPRSNRTET